MIIIQPYVTALAFNEEQLESLKAQGFLEIFFYGDNGAGGLAVRKYQGLRSLNGVNRYVVSDVSTKEKFSTLFPVSKVHEYSFLPDGKIPKYLWETIRLFFIDVMRHFKQEYEAHVWICWSPEKGYHLVVPQQKVSKATVKYNWDEIDGNTAIIVCVHSHNTMGAFFSGTDNNDDAKHILISGVFGHLDKPTPATTWRFNYNTTKVALTEEDIFEEAQVPAGVSIQPDPSWLAKVEEISYTPPSLYGKGNANAWNSRSRSGNVFNRSGGGNAGNANRGGTYYSNIYEGDGEDGWEYDPSGWMNSNWYQQYRGTRKRTTFVSDEVQAMLETQYSALAVDDYCEIMDTMSILKDQAPNLHETIIRESFQELDEEDQYNLFLELFSDLPKTAQERIMATGL